MMPPEDVERYGFEWGPMQVTRTGSFPRSSGEMRCLTIETPGARLDVYVSPAGRSVRVFDQRREHPHRELLAPEPVPTEVRQAADSIAEILAAGDRIAFEAHDLDLILTVIGWVREQER
jgi:hypothetical protein